MARSLISCCIIVLIVIFCSVQAQDGDFTNFTISGNLTFPNTGDYSKIPVGTCLHITVQDNVFCGEFCEIPIRGNAVLTDLRATGNQIPFEVSGSGGNGHYSISFVLNVRSCTNDGSIRKGDYKNDFLVEVTLQPNQLTAKTDAKMSYYAFESLLPILIDNVTTTTKNPTTTTPVETKTPANDVVIPKGLIMGILVLEPNRNYSKLPDGSCLHITVRENILCFDCVIPLHGNITMKGDIPIINGRIPFMVPVTRTSRIYSLSALLNVGSCDPKGLTRRGDYMNEFAVTVRFGDNEYTKDIENEIVMTYYAFDSLAPKTTTTETTATTTKTTMVTSSSTKPTTTQKPTPINEGNVVLKGSIVLPRGDVFTHIPSKSCLKITVNEDIYCGGDCLIPDIANLSIPVGKIDGYKIPYSINVKVARAMQYRISAVLNVGWCPKEEDGEWLRDADYFNKMTHTFSTPANNDRIIKKDVVLEAYKKHLCGRKQCFSKERCVQVGFGVTYCDCSLSPCPDLLPPEWVCGSDGNTYSSECRLGERDCFSGTITLAHKGKCREDENKRVAISESVFLSEKKNLIGVVCTVVILLVAVVVLIFFLYGRRKRKLRQTSTSKDPVIFENSLYDGVSEPVYAIIEQGKFTKEEKTPDQRAQNIYVGLPLKFASEEKKPVSPPPPYEVNKEKEVNENSEA